MAIAEFSAEMLASRIAAQYGEEMTREIAKQLRKAIEPAVQETARRAAHAIRTRIHATRELSKGELVFVIQIDGVEKALSTAEGPSGE